MQGSKGCKFIFSKSFIFSPEPNFLWMCTCTCPLSFALSFVWSHSSRMSLAACCCKPTCGWWCYSSTFSDLIEIQLAAVFLYRKRGGITGGSAFILYPHLFKLAFSIVLLTHLSSSLERNMLLLLSHHEGLNTFRICGNFCVLFHMRSSLSQLLKNRGPNMKYDIEIACTIQEVFSPS